MNDVLIIARKELKEFWKARGSLRSRLLSFLPLLVVFGIYLPLITVNCAVFGVAVLNTDVFFLNGKAIEGSFLKSLIQGFGAGAGYTLAMFIMSGIRERLEFAEVPESLKDVPITFIIASLMSVAFLGFSGFKI